MVLKMKHSNKKSKKHKRFDDHELDSDEKNANGNENAEYDIEASDDEFDEVPSKWFDEFPYVKLPRKELDPNDVEALRNEAEMVLQEETINYKNLLAECKKSEMKWMMTMAKSGTSTDKVAALALMVQESPVHNVSALSSLVNLAKVSKKHQFIVVLETVTELFLSDLLRPSKKLRVFSKQPLAYLSELSQNDNKLRRKRLCYWIFEDKLKGIYEQFVSLLNTAAHDSVQNNREKAIGSMLKLLLENRELENVLVTNLVNKLGDPVHKVASRVVYGLEKVVHKYSKLKESVLDELERMLFRPHIAKRAQYYAICFLSLFKFSANDRNLCKRLISLYFSFFKACVKTGDIDSKLMGALLVGVNRAYPFARGSKKESVIPLEHIDTMYKVVHLAPFKISLQALALLLQVTNNDRYYNALYKKLFDKDLSQTSHQAIWINLMLKSIRKDSNLNRKKSFIKRILQVSLYFPVPLLCGTLIMLSQVMKNMPDIERNLEFPEENVIKDEAAGLEILANLKKFEDDSDEEKYFDAKTDDDVDEEKTTDEAPAPVASSWFHRDLAAPSATIIPAETKHKEPTQYDPIHRNPAFAGGDKATFVELALLAEHFHPTVAVFAKKILNGERINYSGDPLKDFTTLHFLERFSFKNPKRSRTDKGEDKEELFRAVGSQRQHYNPTGMRALPVQSDLYLKQSESAIPVDELFLYKYLKNKKSRDTEVDAKRKRNDDDSDVSDVESVGSVEFNDYLDNLMVGKRNPKSLNFAEDVESSKKKGKKKEEDESEDESDEDEDAADMEEDEDEMDAATNEMSDASDEELEQSSDDGGKEDDENESIDDFESENDDENVDMNLSESEVDEEESKIPLKQALRKRIAQDFGDMAVPLEKFSEMLEEAGQKKSGGSSDVFNKDKSSQKQLKWEASKVKQRWRNKPKPKWKGNKKKK